MSFTKSTQVNHLARSPEHVDGLVNFPVQRGSTVLFKNCAALKKTSKEALKMDPNKPLFTYGRHGTTPTYEFEKAIAELHQGFGAIACSSGTSAIITAISACVQTGDHVLMVDSAYGPTRNYCDHFLKRFGVSTTYYPPRIGTKIESLIQKNTKLIYLESPGSLTFELQDISTLTAIAKKYNIKTLIDNTWASPLYLNPLKLGVDGVIESVTKYIGGHSDLLMGIIVGHEESFPLFKKAAMVQGQYVAPDEVFLAIRGLRTLPIRLEKQSQTTLQLAQWLQQQPQIASVHYPALPSSPDYNIWKKDYQGASGLFAFEWNNSVSSQQSEQFIDCLKLFGIGYSWGGFESLALPVDLAGVRQTQEHPKGVLVRLSIGLEDAADLQNDLAQALEATQIT